MRKQVYIKFRKRRRGEFQFFMHDFVEACISAGIKSKSDLFYSYKWHLRSLCMRIALLLFRLLKPFRNPTKRALIVTANGGTINENVFPYFWDYEIIPMLWDNWPSNYSDFLNSAKLFGIKVVFATSRQVVDRINAEPTSIKAFWIPEGIDGNIYSKGAILSERNKDILEMGRQMQQYHDVLQNLHDKRRIKLTSSRIRKNGLLDEKHLLYASDKEMAEDISRHKIFICFPQCDTSPQRAGNIETLTQRYWEGMLSRCLIIGRAPKELIDLVGYNPVVDVNWENPEQQLRDILDNIHEYQTLVNKNYDTALKFSRWENRIETIKSELTNLGYAI